MTSKQVAATIEPAQHTRAHKPKTETECAQVAGAGKHDDSTYNGRLRLYLEVQSLDDIVIPVNFFIRLYQGGQNVGYAFNRQCILHTYY